MTGPLGLGGLEAAEEDLLTEEAFVVEGVATGDALTEDDFVDEGVATGDALTEGVGGDVEAGNPGGTEGAEDLGFRPACP